jgi:phospholipid/cholesterol/gamma-HCH transport system substrate-binding protein
MKASRNLSWSELKVGVIIIAALVLLAVGILKVGGNSGFFTKYYTLYMRLENTFGLKVGSTVRLAGLDIGSIEDITFPADPAEKKVIVKLNLQEKYQDRIREDSKANIRTLGLLGDKYVDIEVGSPASPVMKDGALLPGGPETQLNRVLSNAGTGIESLNVVLAQLKGVLGDVSEGHGTAGLLLKDPRLYNELNGAVVSLEAVASDLHRGKGSMGKFMNDPAIYDNVLDVSAKAREVMNKLNNGSFAKLSEDKDFYNNLHEISDNLKDVSASSKSLVGNLEKGNLSKLSGDKELYAKIERISARLDTVMAKLDGTEGSAGKLLNDKKLYDNMNKFFEDADTLVVDFKKSPGKYVKLTIF